MELTIIIINIEKLITIMMLASMTQQHKGVRISETNFESKQQRKKKEKKINKNTRNDISEYEDISP